MADVVTKKDVEDHRKSLTDLTFIVDNLAHTMLASGCIVCLYFKMGGQDLCYPDVFSLENPNGGCKIRGQQYSISSLDIYFGYWN